MSLTRDERAALLALLENQAAIISALRDLGIARGTDENLGRRATTTWPLLGRLRDAWDLPPTPDGRAAIDSALGALPGSRRRRS